MSSQFESNLHHAVGMSDVSALLAEAFRFPADDRLAKALADGSFSSDWTASLQDARSQDFSAYESDTPQHDRFQSHNDEGVSLGDASAMRREYSRLFLAPGSNVLIWPYESAFLHRAAGHTDTPNLFRMQTTADTEQQMADAGVRPQNLRIEPCDTISTELDFISYLYARLAEEMQKTGGIDQTSSEWIPRISKFAQSHILQWFPDFFNQVKEHAKIPEYQLFAELGTDYVYELKCSVIRFSQG